MNTTPKGMRLHIGVFGRRNVGKSSIFNNLLHQQVSIVSPVAGTTTDPVEKAMELQPIGPVLFVDTAGIDDMGALGGQRVMQTRKVIERVDVAILVSDAWTEYEAHLLELFAKRKAPVIFVANKADVRSDRILEEDAQKAGVDNVITVSAVRGSGFDHVREAIIRTVPEEFIASPVILSDLVPPGKLAILVIPVDKEAPKGRLILPQAQAIRDLLDHDAGALVVKDSELDMALRQLKEPPALVVTDSQAFEKVAALVPQDVPMTGFSVLFARCKGDLTTMARGAAVVANLRPGARVLIAEACAHHPITDDIGRVKLPRWLQKRAGGVVHIDHVSGRDFPQSLEEYNVIIHCGACTFNRREVLTRMERSGAQAVPFTNYGLAIAACLGLLDRALQPFPEALAAWRAAQGEFSPGEK